MTNSDLTQSVHLSLGVCHKVSPITRRVTQSVHLSLGQRHKVSPLARRVSQSLHLSLGECHKVYTAHEANVTKCAPRFI